MSNQLTTAQAIAKLTAKGRELMTAVGKGEFSFFDEGIVAHSGIWGECMAQEMGYSNPKSASGVMNGTKKLGLWETGVDAEDGTWWELTELGAAVALELAGQVEETPVPVTTVKKGAKWTYVYVDGQLVAEIRNNQAHLLAAI